MKIYLDNTHLEASLPDGSSLEVWASFVQDRGGQHLLVISSAADVDFPRLQQNAVCLIQQICTSCGVNENAVRYIERDPDGLLYEIDIEKRRIVEPRRALEPMCDMEEPNGQGVGNWVLTHDVTEQLWMSRNVEPPFIGAGLPQTETESKQYFALIQKMEAMRRDTGKR
jgi:hypothetical protein